MRQVVGGTMLQKVMCAMCFTYEGVGMYSGDKLPLISYKCYMYGKGPFSTS